MTTGGQDEPTHLPDDFEQRIRDWVKERASSARAGQGGQAVTAQQGGWGFGHLRLENAEDTGDEIVMGVVTVALDPPPALAGADGIPDQPMPEGDVRLWEKYWPPGVPVQIVAVLELMHHNPPTVSHTVTQADLGTNIDDLRVVNVKLKPVPGAPGEICMKIGVTGPPGTATDWAPDSPPL
jgi:hypothetical protein